MNVAAGNGWHYGGIDDAQSFHTMHLKVGINHRHPVCSHGTAASRVIHRLYLVADPLPQLLITLYLRPWTFLAAMEGLHGRLCKNLSTQAYAAHQCVQFFFAGKIAGMNDGHSKRVGTA